jgi:enoyl-CoA hydratase/carnithine racemase
VVSGGVDVKVFDAIASPAEASELWKRLIVLARRLEALECPTVFAAHGLCLTAAFEISLGCDLILAAESARFGLVEIVVGLTPAMGGTQRLVERAGPGRARELVMTGELFDAKTLHAWGVVNRVLPDDGFAEAASAFATRLASGPTRAHAATKAVVRAALDGGVDAADALVVERAGDLFATEDLRNAVTSFLEGRAREGDLHRALTRPLARGRSGCIGSQCHADGNGEMVQRRQGLRLHHAR